MFAKEPQEASLPNGRFIPEAERGWTTSESSSSSTPSRLSFLKPALPSFAIQGVSSSDKERAKSMSSASAPGPSGSSRAAQADTDAPAAQTTDKRRKSLGNLIPFWGSPKAKSRALPSNIESEAESSDGERPQSSLTVALDRTASHRSRTHSDPTTPTASISRRHNPYESGLEGLSRPRPRARRRSGSWMEITLTASRASEGEGEEQERSRDGVRPSTPRVSGQGTLFSHTTVDDESSQDGAAKPRTQLRGYPWRPTPGHRFYVPPSHRNPTGPQAFFDTHFGSSSGWRSVSSLADPVRKPKARGARMYDENGKSVSSGAGGGGGGKDSASGGGWLDSARWKGPLQSRHFLSALGVLAPASGQETSLSPTSSPGHPSHGPRSTLEGPSSTSTAASQAKSTTSCKPYEPEQIPTVHRDPQEAKYFDAIEGNVVLLGGYRGSVLRDAETRQMMWVPIKVGMGLRRPTLEMALTSEAEERAEELVIPDGMLAGIGRIADTGKRLKERISAGKRKPKVYSWGYDWRQSLWRSSRRLEAFLQSLYDESAEEPEKRKGAAVVAHSMGGLVALHALATTSNPRIFSSLVFASTPFDGTANILGPFRYGDSALINDTICSPRATFSFRSSFYLLPHQEGGGHCFEDEEGRPIDLDFLDPETWDELGFSPCIKPGGLRRSKLRLSTGDKVESPMALRGSAANAAADEEQDRTARTPGAGPLDMQLGPQDETKRFAESTALAGAAGAAKLGRALGEARGQGEEKKRQLQPANRLGSSEAATEAAGGVDKEQQPGPAEAEASEGPNPSAEDEETLTWEYLVRTLNETRRFFDEMREGFSEAHFKAGAYPAMAILTSGRTPTVRGALTSEARDSTDNGGGGGDSEGWKEGARAGDYSRMLYAAGDGVILRSSSVALPGRWPQLLARGAEVGYLTDEDGVVETSHRHVTLLSDVAGIGRALESCRRARIYRDTLKLSSAR